MKTKKKTVPHDRWEENAHCRPSTLNNEKPWAIHLNCKFIHCVLRTYFCCISDGTNYNTKLNEIGAQHRFNHKFGNFHFLSACKYELRRKRNVLDNEVETPSLNTKHYGTLVHTTIWTNQ